MNDDDFFPFLSFSFSFSFSRIKDIGGVYEITPTLFLRIETDNEMKKGLLINTYLFTYSSPPSPFSLLFQENHGDLSIYQSVPSLPFPSLPSISINKWYQ